MTQTWVRGGIEYTIEHKAAPEWDAQKHPRDSRGRFIETGAEVRVIGVGLGKVTEILTHDRIRVEIHADGSSRVVDKDALTVMARPDGTAPTADPKLLKTAGAPSAPSSSAPTASKPDAAAKPADSSAGHPFKSLLDLREHLRAMDTGNPGHDQTVHKDAVHKDLALSAGGHLAIAKGTKGTGWRLYDGHTGLKLANLGDNIPTKAAALALAHRFETELVDADGKPFDWSAPDIKDRIKKWKSDQGDTIGPALKRIRDAHDADPDSWKAPAPTVGAPDQGGPNDAAGRPADGTAAADAGGVGADGLRGEGAGALGDVPPEAVRGDTGGGAGAPVRGDGRGDRPADNGPGGDAGGAGSDGKPPVDGGDGAVPGDGEAAGNRPAGRRVRPAAGAAAGGRRPARRRAGRPDSGAAGGQPDPLAQPRPGRRLGAGVTADAPRFHPGGMGDLAPSGEKARVAANMDALRTLRTLQSENRPATAEEQSVLARWGGWGAIPDVFDEAPGKAEKFAAERAELKRILTPKEYNAARRNTINAHYTDPAIAQAMWDGMEKLGFTGGRVLEPGSGAGTFIGLRPPGADMVGVELDPITAGISRYLYPDANVLNESFARTRMPDGAFDAAIGNVPFGKVALNDPKYNKNKHTIHNHFILKSLQMTRPGGMVAILTSRHTLDAGGEAGQKARAEMAALGDFVGAVRLPTGSHRRASGTDVVIDMLVFRRREDPPPPPTKPKKPGGKASEDEKADYTAAVEKHTADLASYQREREAAYAALDKSWAETVEIDVPSDSAEGGTAKVEISRYFADHPDMVLGEVRATRGQHSENELGVVSTTRGEELGAEVAAAMDRLAADAKQRDLLATERNVTEAPLPEIMDASAAAEEGHLEEGTEVHTRVVTHGADGKALTKPRTETTTFTVIRNGQVVPHWAAKSDAAELRDLIGLRNVASALLAAESESGEDTPEIDALRAELNKRYDAYVAAPGPDGPRGPINRQTIGYGKRTTTKDTVDPDTGEKIPAGSVIDVTTVRTPPQGKFRRTRKSALVYALERYSATTGEATKASIFTQRTVAPREARLDADNPVDALAITMDTHGEVKLRTVADLLGVDEAEARTRLGTMVFNHPTEEAPDRLVPSAEYLSGDVRAKLAQARELATDNPELYAPNVAALEAVVPKDLTPEDIKARLGVPWVGPQDVHQFLYETLQVNANRIKVSKLGSSWEVDGDAGPLGSTVWGTDKMDAIKIAQAALENKRPKITRKEIGFDGVERDRPDPQATADAQAKIDDLHDRFQAWLWEDPTRAERLTKLYNDRYNSLVLRQYDTEGHREMPGLAEKYTLRDHQHAAINRMVAEPAVLLAHEVGAGKTLEMIGGAMELRRLGLARKPAIVVPNHMLEQFSREFLEAYPDANILVATEDQMQGDQRREFVARSATGDWDAVIITHSAFGRIPMSPEAQEAYIDREMAVHREEADARRAAIEAQGGTEKQKEKSLKGIEAALIRAEERLKAKMESAKDTGVTFEESGIDYVMVDEAHLFKNLMTPSNVEAVSVEGSLRSADLHMKLDYLRTHNDSNRVATFATATPVSNSMAEMYTMMRYLRPDLLEAQGVRTFDDWAAMHGRMVSDVEITAGGSFKMKARFAEFVNVPELLRVFHTFADVKTAQDLKLPTPKVRGGKPTTIAVDRTDAQAEFIMSLAERAKALEGQSRPKKGEDNHLNINTDGRKAALDLRLVDVQSTDNPKLEAAADNIARIYEANKDRVYAVEGTMAKDRDTQHLIQGTGTPHPTTGALQIVFADLGTPGGKRKVYTRDVNGDMVRDAAGEPKFTMQDSTWNAYDEMRDHLVARDVPRNKIAFIHDAKNDSEKAQMFERARTGEIAVLFGSTAKMGVGTNVQNRAIALHHLDCPWRPTDLVQRNGRIERQGNQHEEIDIFQYVVKDTFDAKSWDTVTKKAKFIGQVMTGSLDDRGVEDIGTSAQSLAEVKAIAANNPHLSEQILNSSRLQGLLRQDRQHTFAQQSLRANAAKYKQQITDGNKMLDKLDAALAQRRDVSGEQFRMSVVPSLYDYNATDSQVFTKRKDANEALASRIKQILDGGQFYYGKDIGEIGGFTVRFEPRRNPQTGEREAIISLTGVPGSATPIDRATLETPNGVTVRMENRLAEMQGTRDRTAAAIADAERKIPIVERNLGQVFAKADELAYVQRRSNVLGDIMELYGETNPEGFGEKLAAFDAELARLDTEWKARGRNAPAAVPDAAPPVVDEPDVALPDTVISGGVVAPPRAPREPRIGDVTSPSTPGPDVLPPVQRPDPVTAPDTGAPAPREPRPDTGAPVTPRTPPAGGTAGGGTTGGRGGGGGAPRGPAPEQRKPLPTVATTISDLVDGTTPEQADAFVRTVADLAEKAPGITDSINVNTRAQFLDSRTAEDAIQDAIIDSEADLDKPLFDAVLAGDDRSKAIVRAVAEHMWDTRRAAATSPAPAPDPVDAPSPIVPGPAPARPDDGPAPDPLAGFDAADRAHIRNIIEERGYQFAAGHFGGAKGVGRYMAEGYLSKYTDQHGLSVMWNAVTRYIEQHPEVLTRSRDEAEAMAQARKDRGEALDKVAGDAFTAGDWDAALAALAELEAHDAAYYKGVNATFAQMRDMIEERRREATPAPEPTPDPFTVAVADLKFDDYMEVRGLARDGQELTAVGWIGQRNETTRGGRPGVLVDVWPGRGRTLSDEPAVLFVPNDKVANAARPMPEPADTPPNVPTPAPEPTPEPNPIQEADDLARRLIGEHIDLMTAGDYAGALARIDQAQAASPTLHGAGDWDALRARVRSAQRRAEVRGRTTPDVAPAPTATPAPTAAPDGAMPPWPDNSGDPLRPMPTRQVGQTEAEFQDRLSKWQRDQMGLDPRWRSSGTYGSITASRLQQHDVIYTKGDGSQANPVELPTSRDAKAGLDSRHKILRVVDRVEKDQDGRYIVHFTDGTSTGREGGSVRWFGHGGGDKTFTSPSRDERVAAWRANPPATPAPAPDARPRPATPDTGQDYTVPEVTERANAAGRLEVALEEQGVAYEKVAGKDRATVVRMPDGAIARRTSQTRDYTHAQVLVTDHQALADHNERIADELDKAITKARELLATGGREQFHRITAQAEGVPGIRGRYSAYVVPGMGQELQLPDARTTGSWVDAATNVLAREERRATGLRTVAAKARGLVADGKRYEERVSKWSQSASGAAQVESHFKRPYLSVRVVPAQVDDRSRYKIGGQTLTLEQATARYLGAPEQRPAPDVTPTPTATPAPDITPEVPAPEVTAPVLPFDERWITTGRRHRAQVSNLAPGDTVYTWSRPSGPTFPAKDMLNSLGEDLVPRTVARIELDENDARWVHFTDGTRAFSSFGGREVYASPEMNAAQRTPTPVPDVTPATTPDVPAAGAPAMASHKDAARYVSELATRPDMRADLELILAPREALGQDAARRRMLADGDPQLIGLVHALLPAAGGRIKGRRAWNETRAREAVDRYTAKDPTMPVHTVGHRISVDTDNMDVRYRSNAPTTLDVEHVSYNWRGQPVLTGVRDDGRFGRITVWNGDAKLHVGDDRPTPNSNGLTVDPISPALPDEADLVAFRGDVAEARRALGQNKGHEDSRRIDELANEYQQRWNGSSAAGYGEAATNLHRAIERALREHGENETVYDKLDQLRTRLDSHRATAEPTVPDVTPGPVPTPAPDVTPEPAPEVKVPDQPTSVPELASVADAARWVSQHAQASTAQLADLKIVFSPQVSSKSYEALRRLLATKDSNAKLYAAVISMRAASADRVNGRRGFDPDRARAIAQRLADGDVSLPVLSVGQRATLTVRDPSDTTIRIRGGVALPPRTMDVDVTVTGHDEWMAGSLMLVGTDDTGARHSMQIRSDGTVRLASPDGVAGLPADETPADSPYDPDGAPDRPDDTAVETYRAATNGAADALARAGDDAAANSVRWAADRFLDAWRFETNRETVAAAAVLTQQLADAKRQHKDNPDVAAWLGVAQLAWSGEVPDLPAGPPEKPDVGPERPGAAFDPDAPDEAVYGVRGRRGGGVRPTGPRTGRPPLYTYQRRNILAYRFDTEHTNADVRAAARALRYYEPITETQAAALAKALRQRAADDGDKRKARSAQTAAARLDIVAGSLGAGFGHPKGFEPEGRPAATLHAGDRVAVPETAAAGHVSGEVVSARIRYAGRVMELRIRDDVTGDIVTRQVLKGTPLGLPEGPAPARHPVDPDPEPLDVVGPQPGTIIEVGVGDTVAIPEGGRVVQGTVTGATALPDGQMLVTVDGPAGPTPVLLPDAHPVVQLPTVKDEPVRPASPTGDQQFVAARDIREGDVIWPRGDESRAFEVETIRDEGGLLMFGGHDDEGEEVESPAPVGGQVFLGHRDPVDPEQDMTPAPDPRTDGTPDRVTREQVEIGDRLRVRSWSGETHTGTVLEMWDETGADRDTGADVPSRGMTLLRDDGNDLRSTYVLVGNDTADLLDRQGAAGVGRAEHEAKVRKAAVWMQQIHAEAQSGTVDIVRRNAKYAELLKGSPAELAAQIRRDLDDPSSSLTFRLANQRNGRAGSVADQYTGDRKLSIQVRDSVAATFADMQRREVLALAQSIEEATDTAAVTRMLDAVTANPEARIGPLYRREAETLIAAVRKWKADGFAAPGAAGPVEPDPIPEVAPVGNLADRVARYRRALPEDMGDFGKRRVRRTATPQLTVDDLATGHIPAAATTEVFVEDVAEDGGPGTTALRNLEVVKAAGRALDTEITARMKAKLGGSGVTEERIAELETASETAQAAVMTEYRRMREHRREAEVIAARAMGFTDRATFMEDMRRTGTNASFDGDALVRYRALSTQYEEETRKALKVLTVDLGPLTAAQAEARRALDEARRAQRDARRESTLEVLKLVRAMGPADDTIIDYLNKNQQTIKRGKLLAAMRWAEQHYPTDWLRRAATGRAIMLDSTTRGSHRSRNKHGLPEIRLSSDLGGEQVTGAGQHGRVALHELGHDMEDVVPGLKALERTYLWQRTTDEGTVVGARRRTGRNALRGLPNSRRERSRRNDFPEPYSGKEYDHGSHELLTTATESLFAGSGYLDDDFRAWVLGVLATAG